jgi:hypothetical protein
LSHVFIRGLATINLADAALESAWPRYAHAVANGRLSEAFIRWLLISSLLLPLLAAIEAFWMWNITVETKALWIDGLFALAWFLTFWLTIGYYFTHRVLFI